MTQPTESINLGFLGVQREPAGYVGGYLVTNRWGRPLEFRLSSPVLPNKVQQILYGPTLEPYLCHTYIGFPGTVSDQYRAWEFIKELNWYEKHGELPNLSIVLLPNDHTSGTRPGLPTPEAAVAATSYAARRSLLFRGGSECGVEGCLDGGTLPHRIAGFADEICRGPLAARERLLPVADRGDRRTLPTVDAGKQTQARRTHQRPRKTDS